MGIIPLMCGNRELFGACVDVNYTSGGALYGPADENGAVFPSGVMNLCTLVTFKKRFNHVASLHHNRLLDVCHSVMNNHQPTSAGKSAQIISYLPEHMDISSGERSIYINVGAGEFVNSSLHNWLKPFYPTYSKSHHVYVINMTSDNSCAVGELGEPADNEGFDFINWFKGTVKTGDFVFCDECCRSGVEASAPGI
uniref:DUF7870 domain-containing protein n=1 Tax=Kalanchoe fedtschenkoi TaxID=63787 RepID=A0A7N1A9W7_KALFE